MIHTFDTFDNRSDTLEKISALCDFFKTINSNEKHSVKMTAFVLRRLRIVIGWR